MTITPEQHREARTLLAPFQVNLHLHQQSTEKQLLRVRGKERGVLKQLNVLLESAEQIRALAEELPGHLLMAPIWKTKRPRHHKFAWAAGYMQARASCLPTGGSFHSVFGHLICPCPYTEAADREAFFAGTEHYLAAVRQHVLNSRLNAHAATQLPTLSSANTAQHHPEAI